jgi:hypothetical protein
MSAREPGLASSSRKARTSAGPFPRHPSRLLGLASRASTVSTSSIWSRTSPPSDGVSKTAYRNRRRVGPSWPTRSELADRTHPAPRRQHGEGYLVRRIDHPGDRAGCQQRGQVPMAARDREPYRPEMTRVSARRETETRGFLRPVRWPSETAANRPHIHCSRTRPNISDIIRRSNINYKRRARLRGRRQRPDPAPCSSK